MFVLGGGIRNLGELGRGGQLATTNIINHSTGVLKFQGSNLKPAVGTGLTSGYWKWTTGTHVTIDNDGTFEILGGEGDGEYGIETVVSRDNNGCTGQNVLMVNDGLMKIEAGSNQGSAAIKNGIGFSDAGGLAEGMSEAGVVTVQNNNELIIQGSMTGTSFEKRSNGIDLLVYGPDKFCISGQWGVKSEFVIENSGPMSWSGSQYGYAIGVLTRRFEVYCICRSYKSRGLESKQICYW